MLKNIKKILIVSPHADDEILGCGGMISKFSKFHIDVLICSNASIGAPELFSQKQIKKVRDEAKKCHQFLKIKKTFFLDLPAPQLDQFPVYKISNLIQKIIVKNNYDTVFMPSNSDLHLDHKIIAHSTIVATRPINRRKINLISYETLSETEWGIFENDKSFIPNLFINLSKRDLDKKIKSFKIFKSQIKNETHPRSSSGIKSLAENRGKLIGEKYAEAYRIIKILL